METVKSGNLVQPPRQSARFWGDLELVEVVRAKPKQVLLPGSRIMGTQDQWVDDPNGGVEPETLVLKCRCGHVFRIETDQFRGRRETRDCGRAPECQWALARALRARKVAKTGKRNPPGRPPNPPEEQKIQRAIYIPRSAWLRLAQMAEETQTTVPALVRRILSGEIPHLGPSNPGDPIWKLNTKNPEKGAKIPVHVSLSIRVWDRLVERADNAGVGVGTVVRMALLGVRS